MTKRAQKGTVLQMINFPPYQGHCFGAILFYFILFHFISIFIILFQGYNSAKYDIQTMDVTNSVYNDIHKGEVISTCKSHVMNV